MNRKLLSTLFSLLTLAAFADNRSLSEMQSIAASKLSGAEVKGIQGRSALRDIRCIIEEPTYGIFTPADAQGFVIVAKSDRVDPVIAYSTERFDATNMPPSVRWYLSEVSRNLEAIEAGRKQAPRRTASFNPVENFVTTQWSQDYPFDRKTPNNYPAGCVATALAQCLNYWQYPPSVDFDGTYILTTPQGKTTKSEKKTEHVSTTYTWPYKDAYKSFGNYGDNIPELLRDCGYATYMEYTQDGSGSSILYVGLALTSIFQYPVECVKYYDQSYFGGDQEAWNQIIYDEMAARSPIVYGAHDKVAGGHAFVFSGVDEDGMVYVNWGWRGSADGFYAIELLEPMSNTGQDHFTEYHRMVTGLRTTPLPTDKQQTYIWGYKGDPYTFRWGIEKDEDEVEHHTLYCDLPYGFINLSPSGFEGVFGLFAQDLTDNTTWVIAEDLQDRDTIPAGYGYCGSSENYKEFYFYYYIDGENGLKPGHTYRIAFGTKDNREGVWRSILCLGGEVAYDVTYTGDPATSTISEVRTPMPVLDGIYAVRQSSAKASDDITRVYDTAGRLVYSAPTRQFNLWDVPARGILVVKQGQMVRKVVR